MKSMNLTYSHKELQWLFFAAVVGGLNSALKMKGYFITFQVTDDSFCFEFWRAARASEKDDGGLISSHKVNKGEYQMNDIRLGVMTKYLEDEASKFMNAISNNAVEASGKKWGTAKWGKEPVLTYDGVMMASLTWEDIANKLNEQGASNETLLFTDWHTCKEFPTEVLVEGEKDGYSEDVLIDIDGYRKKFRAGWYDFDDKEWRLYDIEAQKEIDLEGLRWTELPLNKEEFKV